MSAPELINHDELTDTVERLRLGSGASEVHGSLCGYLAGGGVVGRQSLLAVLQLDGEEVTPSNADQAVLQQLVSQAEHELADSDLGFEPLLPADDRPLPERADALVDWCRGFLGGFGLAGAASHGQLSDEAQEVLRDLGTIAASAFDFGDEGEDEDALIEVSEFVRVGAMLLHAECAGRQKPASGALH
jgi:uncharacterized protein YgfB (UPF0149 family)